MSYIYFVECPTIIPREDWGARPPNGVTYLAPTVPYLFIHHSAGAECFNFDDCAAEIRSIQNYHMDTNDWSDIGYSFLIGGDGMVYEGRGWGIVGAHTLGFNSVGYGVDFIGDFTDHDPQQVAQDAYMLLANCAVALGYVPSTYELYGHRQTGNTECPGNYFYQTIQDYPHWVSGTTFAFLHSQSCIFFCKRFTLKILNILSSISRVVHKQGQTL